MDKECVKLCEALNGINGIQTIESCCGHGKDSFLIWFEAKKVEDLPPVLYYFEG